MLTYITGHGKRAECFRSETVPPRASTAGQRGGWAAAGTKGKTEQHSRRQFLPAAAGQWTLYAGPGRKVSQWVRRFQKRLRALQDGGCTGRYKEKGEPIRKTSRTVVRNERYRKTQSGYGKAHNERKNEAYLNPDVFTGVQQPKCCFQNMRCNNICTAI